MHVYHREYFMMYAHVYTVAHAWSNTSEPLNAARRLKSFATYSRGSQEAQVSKD